MLKDHSDNERGNPLPPHGLVFPISSKVFFYMLHPTDRIAHNTAFVIPVVDHWLEREIDQWVHHEGSIRRPIAPWANAITTELHLDPIYIYIYVTFVPKFMLYNHQINHNGSLTDNIFKTNNWNK